MLDPSLPSLAVAFVLDDRGRLLMVWNPKWRAFTLPMTKIDTTPPRESAADAAIHAASETLGVPTRAIPGSEPNFMRCLHRSKRDGEIKDYQHQIVRIEPHPDFASAYSPSAPIIWASIEKLQLREYQPLSPSVSDILKSCVEWGWI